MPNKIKHCHYRRTNTIMETEIENGVRLDSFLLLFFCEN